MPVELAQRTLAPNRHSPIFVVGCGHSGTTALIHALNKHPDIWAYLPAPSMEYAVKPNSFDSPSTNLIWPPLASKGDARRFSRHARETNATHWAIKSPSNICRLGYILRSLPTARIVMLVRDGRDVMLSLMERFPKANPGGRLCLNRWVYDNQAGLAFQHDPRVLIIKLEDMTDPMADSSYPVLQKVLRHVGVGATPEIVAHLVVSTDPRLKFHTVT